MKRLFGLVLIVLTFFLAMNYFGAKEKIEFKGIKNASLIQTSETSYSLKGELQFFNPSSFSSQLGSVNIEILVNNQLVGHIQQNLSERISSKSSFYFPFEIRFTDEEVHLYKTGKLNEIEISGKSAPNSTFFNYEIPMSTQMKISF